MFGMGQGYDIFPGPTYDVSGAALAVAPMEVTELVAEAPEPPLAVPPQEAVEQEIAFEYIGEFSVWISAYLICWILTLPCWMADLCRRSHRWSIILSGRHSWC